MQFIKLIKSESGTSAVEFALVLPVLAVITFAILELGYMYFSGVMLDRAASDAARFGVTGFIPNNMDRDSFITQTITNGHYNLLDNSKITIDTLVYDSFANIGQPEPYIDANNNGIYDVGEYYDDVNTNNQWDSDMGKSSSGGAGEIVVYKVAYPYQFFTPIIGNLLSDTGIVELNTKIVVRNEPF